jgi:hypothetical protein
LSIVQHPELSPGHRLDSSRQFAGPGSIPYFFGFRISKGLDLLQPNDVTNAKDK